MKKKLCFIGAGAALLLAGTIWFSGNYTVVNGDLYHRETTTLNLSDSDLKRPESIAKLSHLQVADLRNTGLTTADYEMLRNALPNCDILWQIPFQGNSLDPNTESLTISAITEEEMALLNYFPNLKSIDMTGCTDGDAILKLKELYDVHWMVPFQGTPLDSNTQELTIATLEEADLKTIGYFADLKTINATDCTNLDAIMKLAETYPDCRVLWQVPLGHDLYPGNTTTLELADADVQELMANLAYLPQLESVTFTGKVPGNDAIYELKQTYPHAEFIWDFQLCGVTVNSNAVEIDLSDIRMRTVDEVENSLKYFNKLEKVVMCNCGISNEEMDALWKRNPDVRFVWSVLVGSVRVRTDTVDFMPWKLGYHRQNPLTDAGAKDLKYLVDLVVIDLGHNSIQDLSFLYHMPNLEYLLMCDCKTSDITPIASLKKLKYLELFLNNITDLSPLAECTALEDVNLCHNPFQDVSPLLGLNLKNIWVSGWILPKDQLDLLRETFPDARIEENAIGSVENGWRKLPNYYAQRDLLGLWYIETP